MQYKIIIDKQPSTNPSTDKKEYIINIEELRRKGKVYDSINFTLDKTYVTRRLVLSEYGVLAVLDEPVIQNLDEVNIELFEGDNYIYLSNMQGNYFYASYIVKNDFTDTYVTTNRMESAINQSAKEIELKVGQTLEEYSTTEEMYSAIELSSSQIMSEVNKKVGEDEFGTKIEQNCEHVKIAWNQISQSIQLEGDSGDATMAFYDNNTKFAEMGVNTVDKDRYISFAIPCDYGKDIADGMAWGIQTTSDNKFWPILYVKNFHMANQNAGDFSGELVLTACNLNLEGINSSITCGEVKMTTAGVFGGIAFLDKETSGNLLTITPKTSIEQPKIKILDKISFYANAGGTNSFKIGTSSTDYCLMDDTGHLHCTTTSIDELYVNDSARIATDLHVNGKVYADNISSDRRLKTNVKNSQTKAIDMIKKIKHRQFNMKKDGIHYNIGYIAQELEKIDKNFVLIDEKDKNIKKRYYINELPIIATITKAIQEQQEQIEKITKLLEVK